jgi:O-antigen/teichoic acid export membrane protein
MTRERRPRGGEASGSSGIRVRRAAATYATNVGATTASLLNVLLVARVLGPTGRGEIAFLIAIGGIATMFASVGVQDANANLGGQHPEAIPRLATNSVLLALLLGGVAALVVWMLAILVPSVARGADRGLLILALATIPIGLLGWYLKFLLQADYRFGITNIAWFLSPAATALVDGVLALFGVLTVQAAMVCWVFTGVAANLVLVAYVARRYGFGRPDRALMGAALSFGLKTHFGRIMSLGSYRADQWFLGAMAGPHALGLYSVAVTLSEALFYVPGVITLVQRPDLVRASREHAAELASRVLRRALVLAVVAGTALAVAAPFLCVTLFGEQFSGSVDELRVLALGAVGIVTLDLLSNAIIAQRRPLLASGADGAALVLTVVLNLLLIPRLAGLGAAIATTAAYTFGGAVMVVIFLRVLDADWRKLVPRPADVIWYWTKASAQLPTRRRVAQA